MSNHLLSIHEGGRILDILLLVLIFAMCWAFDSPHWYLLIWVFVLGAAESDNRHSMSEALLSFTTSVLVTLLSKRRQTFSSCRVAPEKIVETRGVEKSSCEEWQRKGLFAQETEVKDGLRGEWDLEAIKKKKKKEKSYTWFWKRRQTAWDVSSFFGKSR